MVENRAKLEKDKVNQERERVAELAGKVSFDVKELPTPLPADFETFQKLLVQKAKNKDPKSGKKGLGMGIGVRIPLTEKERWEFKVERWNANAEKKVDPKQDAQPGPMAYSLIAQWADKNSKKENAAAAEKKPNIFKSVSKGPSINPYYARI